MFQTELEIGSYLYTSVLDLEPAISDNLIKHYMT
jgi:hypothetical protein